MPPSIGAAAVQGIETGFSLGQRGLQMRQAEQDRLQRQRDAEQQRADLEEERAYQRTRQKAQDARLASQDDRQRRLDELKALDSEMADLQTEGQGLFSQFGGYDKVPEDVRTDYTGRVRALRGRRGQLRQSFYSQDVGEQKKQAAEVWSRVQAGQMSLEDLGDDDLLRTLVVQTRRPLTDFTRTDPAKPAPIEQAVLDVEAGLETGNRDLLVKGANVLLRPELTAGIGTDGPDGNEIVDKQLYDLVPHPQQPGLFVPILEVTVRRDDGAIGRYRAPVTEGRGVYATDPGAMPKAISVQDAMDRVGQLGALSQFVNDPQVRSRLERASPQAKASADEFLQALSSVGVAKPKAAKITRERVDLGDRIEEREVDEATGKVLKVRDLPKGAPPKAGGHGAGGHGAGGLDVPAPALPKGLTGPKVLDGLSEDDATIVEGLANGSIRPSEISTRGNRRERMLALAKRYDPAADFGPDGRLKEVPAAVRTASLENQTNLRRAERALRLVGGAPAREGETQDAEATGLKGYLPNQLLNRVDPKGVEARAAIADLGSLVIHSRSGAAVTAAEFPRLTPFIPSEKDDADTVKKKLRAFVTVYKEEIKAMEQTYSKENGYKPLAGADEKPAPPPPAAPPAPDGKPPLPPVDRRGWNLMVDGKGNRAYVSPDGMNFEEVR